MIGKILSPRRWWHGSGLFLFFAKEVVVANLQVVRLLFVPNAAIRPAVVKMPLKAESEWEIFLLTTMITLTPGTLSLSVSDDRKFLYFHVIHTNGEESTVRSIQAGFERMILEVFR